MKLPLLLLLCPGLGIPSRCYRHTVQDYAPLVMTRGGAVLGRREEAVDTRQNITVSWTAYYDLPYAAPPVGPLRFLVPQPPTPWTCVRSASSTTGAVCPQPKLNLTLGGLVNGGLHEKSDEDCLLVNVYVPDTAGSSPLPVLFWTHGGGYNSGSGSGEEFGPLYYLSHGVVVVTVRYRLGSLGFLSLGTEDVPGNMGVRDQVMALQWVQENIASFGGDPDMVTVMGQSAGSMSTTYHLYSPLAQGLFRRVILQSGTGGFAPSYKHFTGERAVRFGRLAAIELGCMSPIGPEDLEETAACLRGKPVLSLLSTEILNELQAHPCIDGGYLASPYLPLEPEEAITTGQYSSQVDVLLGFMSDETLIGTQWFYSAPDLFNVAKELWPILGPYALLQKHISEQTPEDLELATSILNYYVGELEDLSFSKFDNFTNMFDDSFMIFATHRFLDLHLPRGSGKTYLYRNSYYGEYHNVMAPGIDQFPGVGHSDDLYLQWTHVGNTERPLNPEDAAMSLKLTRMWTDFVKFGSPSPPGSSLIWQPVTSQNRQWLDIGEEGQLGMALDPDHVQRMQFWDSIFPVKGGASGMETI